MNVQIGALDFVVIAVYFVTIISLGLYAGIRQRQTEGSDYFLAGRSLSWFAIGLALFSTNISTLELVSLMEEGYKRGVLYGNTETLAAIPLIILALFFAPFYIRSQVTTLPNFLEKRYGATCRYLLVVFALGYAVFGHLGFAVFTGGKVVEGLFGIPLMYGMTGVLILTGLYTIIGGLKSVVITEAIQTVVLLCGMLLLAAVAYIRIGGWNNFSQALADEPLRLQLLRSDEAAADMSWFAVLLGYPIIGIWFFCTDQTIVQRVLGAQDRNHAQVGALFAGFIKCAGLFLFVLPGIFLYVLTKQEKLPPLEDTATALPYMISHLLPPGLVGVMAAAMLSALMSTIAGALNSIATLCCYDIYRPLVPAASQRAMVRIGRFVTLASIVAVIVWAPYIENFGSILEGNTMLIAYMSPSVTAVFLWGVFWRRASNAGAIACLAAGIVLGIALFILDWNDHWPVSFMLTCFGLFLLCSLILGVASLMKPDLLSPEAEELVWANPLEVFQLEGWSGVGNFKFLALLLLLVTIAIYVFF